MDFTQLGLIGLGCGYGLEGLNGNGILADTCSIHCINLIKVIDYVGASLMPRVEWLDEWLY